LNPPKPIGHPFALDKSRAILSVRNLNSTP
jgi:hypothetical protein